MTIDRAFFLENLQNHIIIKILCLYYVHYVLPLDTYLELKMRKTVLSYDIFLKF